MVFLKFILLSMILNISTIAAGGSFTVGSYLKSLSFNTLINRGAATDKTMAKVFPYLQKGTTEYNQVSKGIQKYINTVDPNKLVTGVQFQSEVNTRFEVSQEYLLYQVERGNVQSRQFITDYIQQRRIILNLAQQIENNLSGATKSISQNSLFTDSEKALLTVEMVQLRKRTAPLLSSFETATMEQLVQDSRNFLKNVNNSPGANLLSSQPSPEPTLDKAIFKNNRQLDVLNDELNKAQDRLLESRKGKEISNLKLVTELNPLNEFTMSQVDNIYTKAVDLGFALQIKDNNVGIIEGLKIAKQIYSNSNQDFTIEMGDIALKCL
jgi:hypothetical protein